MYERTTNPRRTEERKGKVHDQRARNALKTKDYKLE